MPNVCVEVRIRPSSRNILEFSGNKIVVGSKIFTFSKIHYKSTQNSLFNTSIVPFIEKFLNGGNCSILVYGQTGSGKTYTMGLSHKYENGIIQNSLEMIFKKEFTLRCSFIEIYNEEIYDLMSDLRTPLSLRTTLDNMNEVNIIGLNEIPVSSFQEAIAILKRGSENRTTKSTKMNSESSRSHAIFTVSCLQEIENRIVESKLTFVDLAGSERLKRSECIGKAAKEAISINCGLLSLGNVINALYLKKPHVPFRDSKLTRILQKCLIGNTLLIACISGRQEDSFETANTLKYASRAALISLNEKVHIENDKDKLVILNLKKEISRLKEENNRLRMQVVSRGMKDEGVLGHPLVAELMNRLKHYEGEIGVKNLLQNMKGIEVDTLAYVNSGNARGIGLENLLQNMKGIEVDTLAYVNNGNEKNKIKKSDTPVNETSKNTLRSNEINRNTNFPPRGIFGRNSNSKRFENIRALMKNERKANLIDVRSNTLDMTSVNSLNGNLYGEEHFISHYDSKRGDNSKIAMVNGNITDNRDILNNCNRDMSSNNNRDISSNYNRDIPCNTTNTSSNVSNIESNYNKVNDTNILDNCNRDISNNYNKDISSNHNNVLNNFTNAPCNYFNNISDNHSTNLSNKNIPITSNQISNSNVKSNENSNTAPNEILVNSINGNESKLNCHEDPNRVKNEKILSRANSIFEQKINLTFPNEIEKSETRGSKDGVIPDVNFLKKFKNILNQAPFNTVNLGDFYTTNSTTQIEFPKQNNNTSDFYNKTNSTNGIQFSNYPIEDQKLTNDHNRMNEARNDNNNLDPSIHVQSPNCPDNNQVINNPNNINNTVKRSRLVSFDLEPKSKNQLFTPLKEIQTVKLSLIDEFENFNAISLIKHNGKLYFNCIDSKIRMFDGNVHIIVSDDSIRCLFSYENDLFYSSRSLLKILIPNGRPLPVFAYKTEITVLKIYQGLIFTGHDDGTINILDRKSNEMIYTEKIHKGTVFDILISESGIFSCSRDHAVKFACTSDVHEKMKNIYSYLHKNTEDRKCINFISLNPPHYDTVSSLTEFKGKCISVSRDCSIKIWNNSKPFKTVPYAHDSWIKSVTSLENFFVTGCKNGVLKCWNFVDHSIRCIGKIEIGFSINALTSFDGDIWISCQNKKIQRYSIR